MKRFFTLLAVFAILLAAGSCQQTQPEKEGADPGGQDNPGGEGVIMNPNLIVPIKDGEAYPLFVLSADVQGQQVDLTWRAAAVGEMFFRTHITLEDQASGTKGDNKALDAVLAMDGPGLTVRTTSLTGVDGWSYQ